MSALVGLVFGLTQVVHGFYDETTWGPVALGLLVVLLALAVGAPRRIPLAAVLPLLALCLWSLLSSAWSPSADAAWSAAARWLLYGVALAIMLWLLAGRPLRSQALLAGVTAGLLGVALWMMLRMLTGHGASLFLGNRLNDPLGYINGQAGYLLAGFWPCCALAERRRPAVLSGLGMAGGVLLVGLGALTHSRSWELGLAVSLLLVVVAFPGRRRRIVLLLGVALAIYLIHTPLGRPFGQGVTTNAAAKDAAVAIALAALVAGVAWAAAVWALERTAPEGPARGRVRWYGAIGLAGVALAGVALIAVDAGRIGHTVRADYHQFVHLAPSSASSRFLSGGGNRYDYWRVAWSEFRSAPVVGVGAGGYPAGYYRQRRTTEAITQPHSIEMQTLAELGVVGAVLLVAFVAAAGRSMFRASRLARADLEARFVVVASGGLFVGWLAQTSADWEHLVPGLTLIALGALASLQTVGGPVPGPLVGRARRLAASAAILLAAGGAVLLAPRILALHDVSAARTALAHADPRAAINDATHALDYDPDAVQARVLRAAAFARLNAFSPARGDLQHAITTEPDNWVTWALLGDLLTRRGDLRAARAAYRHARRLDPLDGALLTPTPL